MGLNYTGQSTDCTTIQAFIRCWILSGESELLEKDKGIKKANNTGRWTDKNLCSSIMLLLFLYTVVVWLQ